MGTGFECRVFATRLTKRLLVSSRSAPSAAMLPAHGQQGWSARPCWSGRWFSIATFPSSLHPMSRIERSMCHSEPRPGARRVSGGYICPGAKKIDPEIQDSGGTRQSESRIPPAVFFNCRNVLLLVNRSVRATARLIGTIQRKLLPGRLASSSPVESPPQLTHGRTNPTRAMIPARRPPFVMRGVSG